MNKLLIICGPTATGKTKLAIDLAKKFNGELVSADSRQVYRGMDIGTGKDLWKKCTIEKLQLPVKYKNKVYDVHAYDMRGIPLWMYDIANPDEEFSVSQYRIITQKVIADIRRRGKLPIIVGGTGLYIQSLIKPMRDIGIPVDMKLRKTLSVLSVDKLKEKLEREFPLLWTKLNQSDRNNSRRLIRKIEIGNYYRFHTSLLTKSRHNRNLSKHTDILAIALTAEYPALYARIDTRVEQRLKDGIISEISSLMQKGYGWHMRSFNTFGYSEWREWFEQPESRSEAMKDRIVQQWKYDEHAYARRQITWFQKQPNIQWFDITNPSYVSDVTASVSSWYTTT